MKALCFQVKEQQQKAMAQQQQRLEQYDWMLPNYVLGAVHKLVAQLTATKVEFDSTLGKGGMGEVLRATVTQRFPQFGADLMLRDDLCKGATQPLPAHTTRGGCYSHADPDVAVKGLSLDNQGIIEAGVHLSLGQHPNIISCYGVNLLEVPSARKLDLQREIAKLQASRDTAPAQLRTTCAYRKQRRKSIAHLDGKLHNLHQQLSALPADEVFFFGVMMEVAAGSLRAAMAGKKLHGGAGGNLTLVRG